MVYFLQATPGPISIGYTANRKNLPARINSMQAGNCDELSCLGAIESGSPYVKRRLHWKFRLDWIRGDWFAGVDTLLKASECVSAAQVFHLLAGYEGELSEYEVTFGPPKPARFDSWCAACNATIHETDQIAKVADSWVHLTCAEDPPAIDFIPMGNRIEASTGGDVCPRCHGTIFADFPEAHERCNSISKPRPRKRQIKTNRQKQEMRELKTRRTLTRNSLNDTLVT